MTNYRHMTIGLMMIAALAMTTAALHAADEPAAAEPAEKPAEAAEAQPAAQGAELATRITAVEGIVQVRQAEDQPWQMAKAGMKLNAGAEFRTGPRSKVQFKVGDTQTITLDRLGVIKVVDAIRANGKVTTDLGMKYGRSELKVEAGGLEHESRIHAPGSTLAVRGSAGVLQSDSFTSTAYCTEHEASVEMRDRRFGRVVYIEMPEPVITTDEHGDPIRTAMMSDAYNPQAFGSTPNEQELFASNPDGKFLFDSFLGSGGVDQHRDAASAMSQMSSIYDLVHNDSGGGGSMMGTFTSGVLNVSVAFESLAMGSPANVNLILTIPGQGNLGPGTMDPNGVFVHGGNATSTGSGDIVGETIMGSSMTNLPTGTYTAILQNLGTADASILSVQAQGATGGGANQVFAQQAGLTVNSGSSTNINFTVPEMTPPGGT